MDLLVFGFHGTEHPSAPNGPLSLLFEQFLQHRDGGIPLPLGFERFQSSLESFDPGLQV